MSSTIITTRIYCLYNYLCPFKLACQQSLSTYDWLQHSVLRSGWPISKHTFEYFQWINNKWKKREWKSREELPTTSLGKPRGQKLVRPWPDVGTGRLTRNRTAGHSRGPSNRGAASTLERPSGASAQRRTVQPNGKSPEAQTLYLAST